MLPTNKAANRTGDCEVCDATDIEVSVEHGNILMCASCKQNEDNATAKAINVNSIISQSQAIDSNIQLKTDIFVAKTVAAVELHGAILADDAIPADQKDYAYAKICLERFQHFQKVVFEERAALLEKENEMRMWQVNAQTAAGKLRTELRAQFKSLDITYQPNPVKTPKPAGTKSPASYKKQELIDAAKKYGVPADGVRMTMISRNMTADAAAKFFADKMAGK